jgi:hypothetical protein
MALLSSGELSFSAIAGELAINTPYSLRNMSSIAGFSTPDSANKFYGYRRGLTGLFLSFSKSDEEICSLKTIEFYSDDSDFSKSTSLYLDANGEKLASTGYYSNKSIIRLLDGESFDSKYQGLCKK